MGTAEPSWPPLPVDEHGRFVDSGFWRDRARITHWHLVGPRVWSVADRSRFEAERVHLERMQRDVEVARTPREVVEWLSATQDRAIAEYGITEDGLKQAGLLTAEEVRSREEIRAWVAVHGRDVCANLPLGAAVVHFSAYAMTAGDCPRVHA